MLDAANGMGGHDDRADPRAPAARTPSAATSSPTARFPHYEPNPLLEENRAVHHRRASSATGADLGIAWDGDADRCFFIDDTGEFVPGDFITALLAEAMLAKRSRRDDPLRPARLARRARHSSSAWAARAIASRVGHAFIKHRMREENALFAGEVSGHYYFRDFYGVDTGIVPALVVLELVSRTGEQALRAARAAARALPPLGRDQLDGRSDVPLKLQELKERYGPRGEGGRVTHLDGVSVEFDDWHFNVRPSNTEPLLRLNLEAYTARRDGAPARRGARR